MGRTVSVGEITFDVEGMSHEEILEKWLQDPGNEEEVNNSRGTDVRNGVVILNNRDLINEITLLINGDDFTLCMGYSLQAMATIGMEYYPPYIIFNY